MRTLSAATLLAEDWFTTAAFLFDGRHWSTEDDTVAAYEGWGIFLCGGDDHPPYELERIDSPEAGEGELADDEEAWELVVAKARAGSLLHMKALMFLLRNSIPEFKLIAAHVTQEEVAA